MNRLRNGPSMLGALCISLGLLTSACAVSDSDVERWQATKFGPNKLYAVVTHSKYAFPLRVHAALSIIRITPRGGKRLAIPLLVDGFEDDEKEKHPGALFQVDPDTRAKLVSGMEQDMLTQIKAPPPPKREDGTRPTDESTVYKDVAFAMLSHDPPVVTDEKVKAELAEALIQWATTDFESRIDYTTQQYGIEQMMRFLGGASVKSLPTLITDQSTKVDRIARLIAELGDNDTKQHASVALVAMAKKIEAPDWIPKQLDLIHKANDRNGQKVSEDRVLIQAQKFQDQELTKVFTAMKSVGGRATIDYLLDFANKKEKERSEEQKKASLAALEGRIDKGNPHDLERLLSVARDDSTPDGVRDLAFARIGELPKEVIAAKVYPLFDGSKNWKVRWVAASLVLKTITTKHLGEFMGHLPKSHAQKMGMGEPISYGGLIQKMEAPNGEPKPRDAVTAFINAKEIGPRLTALGFFYGGSKADVPFVQSHENDKEPIPKCESADDCGWVCEVPKAGAADKAEKDSKEIKTVGEFVKFCVIPSMQGG